MLNGDRGGIFKMEVYLLQHSYEYGENQEYTETKLIGIFSSYKNAEDVIEQYKCLPGFNKYDQDCFFIDKYTLDESHWKSGFISYDEND